MKSHAAAAIVKWKLERRILSQRTFAIIFISERESLNIQLDRTADCYFVLNV